MLLLLMTMMTMMSQHISLTVSAVNTQTQSTDTYIHVTVDRFLNQCNLNQLIFFVRKIDLNLLIFAFFSLYYAVKHHIIHGGAKYSRTFHFHFHLLYCKHHTHMQS